MNTDLPILYIGLLLVILVAAGWAVLRQILQTRKVENSLERLQSKLTKEKGTAQEYFELGSIYLTKRIYAQASVQFKKALKDENISIEENALIYNALGFAYFSQEQYDLAIRHYKDSLKANPNYVTALNNIGHAYERKQLMAQALEAYEQVLLFEPENSTAKRRAESLRKRFVPTV
ncbi:tetratricopeptide repeat protein [Phormidium sp. CLA17]|uniref:tetratricopeptide repeat protein n=1 Tax=Leptolyngbya sp. Cla-17 TaxID=2803751 RepID=UPI001490E376|nr:tetratricopeptide repeat protein [Leptolyngbya sp. Cla-17]MBM0741845.1 tetratricopeptide repeat protein [Leptolyngbya sp. Cla-17]